MTGQSRRRQRVKAAPVQNTTASFGTGRMDANGTTWRMRSLVAMGHDATRIARALDIGPDVVQRLIRGDNSTITVSFHLLACRLWDAWWDKTPPERTVAERRAAGERATRP